MPPSAGPKVTVEQLIRMRDSAEYRAMESLIVPRRAEQVVRTITAVDDFLGANRGLGDYVRGEFSPGLAGSIDQSYFCATLDIFSSDVRLVDETITGDSAEVAYLVGGRIPLKRARLERLNGTWRYDPGPGYDPDLPTAFERMADGLRAVLDDLRSGRLSREAIVANPEKLIDEVRVRLLPGVKLLKRQADP
jgi:hypothetical protein